MRHNIVSLERGENQVLAQVRNLSTSLSAAQERVANAEGKLRALTESAAAGKTVVRAKDDPTLANLEQRASQLREELQELDRDFTPGYLAKDPKAVTLQSRLAELERQIVVQREAGQRGTRRSAGGARQRAGGGGAPPEPDRDRPQGSGTVHGALQRIQVAAGSARRHRDGVPGCLEASGEARGNRELAHADDQGTGGGRDTPAAVAPALLARHRAESRRFPRARVAGDVARRTLQSAGAAADDGPRPAATGGLPYAATPHALRGQGGAAIALEASSPALLPQPPTFPRELRQDEVAALVRHPTMTAGSSCCCC